MWDLRFEDNIKIFNLIKFYPCFKDGLSPTPTPTTHTHTPLDISAWTFVFPFIVSFYRPKAYLEITYFPHPIYLLNNFMFFICIVLINIILLLLK